MKTFKHKYIVAFALFAAAFGCKKALNLNPQDTLSDAAYWKKANDFKLAANAFYLYERTFAGTVTDGVHSDLRSDLLTNSTKNIYSNGTNSVVQSDGTYNTDYQRIRNINFMLDKASTYAAPAEISQYVAEAKFFRAYIYFDLLQAFGGVTIVSKPLDTNDPLLTSPRNTRDEVADFIIADLKAAIPDLPLESVLKSSDEGRVSKGAAGAFLSRVALYEGTWQKFRGNTSRANALLDVAINSSKDVMTSSQYALFGTTGTTVALGDSALKYMFILENTKSNPASVTKSANTEYILANRYDENIRISNLNITKTTFANGSVDWPTRKLANLYLCSDGLPIDKSPLFKGYGTARSEFANRDKRMQYTLMVTGNDYWSNANYRVTWKNDATDVAHAGYKPLVSNFGTGYQNQKWASERNVADNYESYDYPVIRYAEVLLNYAEATFERNGSISDADLNISLNQVRHRVNSAMPLLTNDFVTANGLDMQTEIRRERSVELYHEGFRIDDLKRWKTAGTEMPMPALGIKWAGTEFTTIWAGASTIPQDANGVLVIDNSRTWQDKNYLLPIPQDQIKLNNKLTQNPGW
ncbi:Starch-binding associating with outer membrane [Mucilaginibacter gossypiicola]|uniref:Starch-binding associating with outer membrane n=1 Tax=Mucilaginibacter gossypiicola TaxID=551995 RepID=A0A1H8LNY9_9SPHI|nr:RagB/SusD family nutrient uptake outer membrane protein [Mucilaginibacter gossypiicola]SEO06733.1 Starch-binding associating with outer membrane [Mucilaginibacter gossypiicola]